MSLDTRTNTLDISLVTTLLKERNPKEARRVADRLIESGTPFTRINYESYPVFERLALEDPEYIAIVADCFSGYPHNWNCWLKRRTPRNLKTEKTAL